MRFSSLSFSLAPALAAGLALSPSLFADEGPDSLAEELIGKQNLIVRGSARFGVSRTNNRDRIDPATEWAAYEKRLAAARDKSRVRAARTKTSQTAFYIGPTITLEKEVADRIRLRASYSPVFNWYDHVKSGSDEFKLNHTLRVDLDYRITPRTLVGVKDNLMWTGQRDIFYGDEYEFDRDRETHLSSDDYFVNTFRVYVRRDFAGDNWAKVTFRDRVKRYDDDDLARYQDEDEFGGRLDLMHVFSRSLELGLFADYTSWDRRSDPSVTEDGAVVYRFDQGLDYITLGAQGTYDFSGHKNNYLYGAVGWNHVWYEADELDDRDLWGDSVLELRLFQQHDTQLYGGVRYGRDYSEIYPFSSQDDLAGYASIRQYFGVERRFNAEFSVELRRRMYNLYDDLDPESEKYGYWKRLMENNNGDTDYNRDTLYLKLMANYRFTDWFKAGAYYHYNKVDSDLGQDYKEHVFGARGEVRFF